MSNPPYHLPECLTRGGLAPEWTCVPGCPVDRALAPASRFKLDVEKAQAYFATHREPHGGWIPQHLMFGAMVPTLGEYGEGNDDIHYATRVCAAALAGGVVSDEPRISSDLGCLLWRRVYEAHGKFPSVVHLQPGTLELLLRQAGVEEPEDDDRGDP